MRTRGQAGTHVDTALISTTFTVDQSKLQVLLDAPTTELVRDFLAGLTAKAEEIGKVTAEKLRADVELENTIRTHEAKTKALKSSLTKSQREVEDLRKNVTFLENARAELRSEIDEARSKSSDSTSEVGVLHSRISSLEASNRETLSVLEAKSTAHDILAGELTAQHQKILTLRREVSQLEDTNQSLENAATSQRFRQQGLAQELDLLKGKVVWYEQELKTRSEESSKSRKEKNARIAELQRANEEATASLEALKRTENALRQRLDEVSQKADDAFSKIQKMQEASADTEAAFKTELESARRLADLQKQSADTARARLLDVTTTLEQVKDSAAEEIGLLQAEIETERSEREATESKISELELQLEQLQASQVSLRQQTPTPATPARHINGLISATPMKSTTPLPTTPATARSKGNLTFTQLFSEVSDLRSQLEHERNRNASLTQEFDQMLHDLENREPEQDDLRQDKDRLEAEVMEISNLLNAAIVAKDEAMAEARKREGEIDGFSQETRVLRQQLRDLSAQIKVLLVELQARDQGLEMLDSAGSAQLRMLAAGELDDNNSGDQTSAGALISQRLLLFRNVSELQEQNIQLLKLNRGLADQMEGDEAKARQAKQAESLRDLEDLQKRVQRYQHEIQSLNTQSESITRERDMFRRMLSHRGPLPANPEVVESMFGQSLQGETFPPTPRAGQRGSNSDIVADSTQLSEYAKLVKELQSHLDTIRREASTDHGILRQQADALAKEKSDLQSEIARNGGQISLAHERYEMLQANYRMLQTENGELQKRTQILNENAAKQDLRTQQVAEDLVDARAVAEGMRAESSNLKAERELLKSIEGRLTEDNRQLMDDRGRLNKMLAELQSLQNERETADSENRRRLQSRIENLESDLGSVRNKLDAETEESKKANLRREYEQEQSKKRIDDLIKALSEVREELVAAKTTRDQLQTRVDEIKIDLRNAEEKAQALQPRPSSGGPLTISSALTAEESLTREQELGVEVADLKRDVELARTELENAKAQVEQYKAISQASEEELQSFNETNDQYREDTDRQLMERNGVIQQLEQRIEDISNELSTSNAELSDLRTQHEQSGMQLEAQKTSLEGDLARLQVECERQTEKAKMYQQDLKAQAQIAQQAQQSYEDELVKHADAARNLQTVRVEYNTLRTEVASIRADAEASKASLSQGQEKWSELRDQYEKELNETRSSRNDMKSQNKLLHEQLESVGTQISALQQHRSQSDNNSEVAATTVENAGSKLQEVITYLRREKEIIDVQYELAVQESKRKQQQLDYVQSQLDETRFKLSDERRQRTDQEANANSHGKLLETINELNLYRESSATLRQESRQAHAKLQEKIKEVEDLTEQILPLQSKIRETENELEMKEGELRLLQEDRDRWRERTQNIISKYDRVDPAEIEGMKTKISELEATRDELQATIQDLQQQMEAFPAQIQQVQDDAKRTWEETKAKIVQQAKERSRQERAKIQELEKELSTAKEERDNLRQDSLKTRQDLDQTQTTLNEVIAERDAAQAVAAAAKDGSDGEALAQQAVEENEEGQIDEGDMNAPQAETSHDLPAKLQLAEQTASEQSQRAEDLQAQHSEEIQVLKQNHEQEMALLKEQHHAFVEKVLKEGDEAVEKAKSTAQNATTNGDAPDQEKTDAIARAGGAKVQFTDEQARELVAKNELIRSIVRRNVTNKVGEETKKIKEELEKSSAEKLSEETKRLVIGHEEAIAALKSQAQLDKEESISKAVNLETMKQKAKLGMAEGGARTAKAKLEVVETAARDTPQKPVVEVWEVAKMTKAAPAAPAGQISTPVKASPVSTLTSEATAKPAPIISQSPVPTLKDEESKLAARQARFGGAPATGVQGDSTIDGNAATTASDTTSSNLAKQGEIKQGDNSNNMQATGNAGPASRGGGGLPRPGSSLLPRSGMSAGRGRGIPQPTLTAAPNQMGRGGQSGLPRGTAVRGNRGGGMRGGMTGASGPGGNLNASAQQFVPGGGNQGAKRPFEGGDNQGDGKRIRGGGPSA
ncbi:hypothetical protein ANO11243_018840 [Dothideomycetidae sp. 11243]|nr:hypothetical protein ANO11243_018840 [fungal sp. No.11243]